MTRAIRRRVLCVEDNFDECELVREVLNEFDVTCVATIKQAMNLLDAETFDLAIIDEHLPDGSGMQLCGKLANAEAPTPCIMISGDTFITLNEAQDAGAKTLLAKSMGDYIESLEQSVERYARSNSA